MTKVQSPTVKELTHAYGLDASFYGLWLDPYLAYSCGNWDNASDLATAQRAKLDGALDSLALKPGGRFLDVGCGWGSLLRRGSERGYVATGLVPVQSQASHCRDLGHKVFQSTWQEHTATETYDAIASIGAFEHFAARKITSEERTAQYAKFFDWAADRLQPGGRMYLQTICFLLDSLTDLSQLPRPVLMPLVRRMRPVREEWPNSSLPTGLGQIVGAANARFEVVSVRARRHDYARTCQAWLDRLADRRTEAVELVGEDKVRRFENYLNAAAPAFSQGWMTLYQLVLAKRMPIAELGIV
jgi:cyclopropane-fatty-acyl-phospholipid synthase